MRALGGFPEKDFEFFRKGVSSGRLNPANMGKRLFVFPLLSLLFLFGSTAELSVITNLYKIWSPLLIFQWILQIIMGLLSVLFFFRWISLRLQKIQMIVLIISSVSMAFNMTFFFLIVLSERITSFSFTVSLLLYILGSILIFCLSLIRAYRLLKKGEFRENGRGLMGKQYGERVNSFSSMFSVIFPIVILGGLVMSFLGNMGQDIVILSVMLVMSFFMYTVVATEFIFVFYCKLRFLSFNITETEQTRIDKEAGLLKAQLKQFNMEGKKESRRQKLEKKRRTNNRHL